MMIWLSMCARLAWIVTMVVTGLFSVKYFSVLTTIIFPVASDGLLPEGTGCFLIF
jgi:hypothetical protein